MLVGAYLPRNDTGAQEAIRRSGHSIRIRTSDLHRSHELELFDCVVVLEDDGHAARIQADYEGRCEVRCLKRNELETLGESKKKRSEPAPEASSGDGDGDEAGHEGAGREEAPEASAEEEPAKAEAQSEPSGPVDLEALKRPDLLRYAASKYPGQQHWMRLDNDALREAIRELGG